MSCAVPGRLRHIRWSQVVWGGLRPAQVASFGQKLGKSWLARGSLFHRIRSGRGTCLQPCERGVAVDSPETSIGPLGLHFSLLLEPGSDIVRPVADHPAHSGPTRSSAGEPPAVNRSHRHIEDHGKPTGSSSLGASAMTRSSSSSTCCLWSRASARLGSPAPHAS